MQSFGTDPLIGSKFEKINDEHTCAFCEQKFVCDQFVRSHIELKHRQERKQKEKEEKNIQKSE